MLSEPQTTLNLVSDIPLPPDVVLQASRNARALAQHQAMATLEPMQQPGQAAAANRISHW